MVLIRCLLLATLAAGCGQSLFDANGGGDGGADGGGTDGPVATSCPAPCLGDAAGDFDGTPAGSGGRWAYLDDHRNRTWTPMTPSADVMVGGNPANQITTCAAKPGAPACAALPGALLVSSAGATSGADPAIAYTASSAQVIQLTVRVHVPSGAAAQIVRLYRNSREDVLITATATPGTTLDRAISLDALAGDRFLVALAPSAAGATDVGVHLFVNDTQMVFPSACQLAATFSAAAGTAIDNLCGADLTYYDDLTSTAVTPTLAAGPFPELGQAADIPMDHYYEGGATLTKTGDTTVQLWVKHDAYISPYSAWVFSDEDLNAGGGLGFVLYDDVGTDKVDIVTCTDPNNLMFSIGTAAYPTRSAWHFVRIVHTGGTVSLCVDGQKRAMFAAAAGQLTSTFKPHLGKNVVWTPQGAFFDGQIDDVRVFATALPCE